MEFLVENWLWFLIGGIVVLMTLIGYIADKTDFGRNSVPKKEKTKKVNKKENKKINVEQSLTDTLEVPEAKPEVQMSLATDSILEEQQSSEDLNVPFGDVEFEMPADEDTSDMQVEETSSFEDLNVPFGNVSFEEPSSTLEEIVAPEPNEELKLDDVSVPNIELPDLDSIVSEEDDSDDVWKF